MHYRNLSFIVAGLAAAVWVAVALAHTLHENAEAPLERQTAMTECEKRELRLATITRGPTLPIHISNRAIRTLESICASSAQATNH